MTATTRIAALTGVGDIDPAEIHSNLGVAYALIGRRALAIREFEEALRIRPGFEQARANLARARAK